MLGPALTRLLHDLAANKERTPEQARLFEELALVAAAFNADNADRDFLALHKEIRSSLNIDKLTTFTRPDPDPAGYKVCTCCGQRIR